MACSPWNLPDQRQQKTCASIMQWCLPLTASFCSVPVVVKRAGTRCKVPLGAPQAKNKHFWRCEWQTHRQTYNQRRSSDPYFAQRVWRIACERKPLFLSSFGILDPAPCRRTPGMFRGRPTRTPSGHTSRSLSCAAIACWQEWTVP